MQDEPLFTEPLKLANRYELRMCVARGGMGEVWKAFDTQLRRQVAIKLLRPDRQERANFVVRFAQEARLIAALSHPNIVKIHNFYAEDDPPQCYMVMDFIEGPTLADYIRSTSRVGNFPAPATVLYIFSAIGQALDYAHECGLIHRDVKPANILLDQQITREYTLGRPVLTDFGIARRLDTSAGTAVGSLIGTPVYLSPEQAQGQYSEPRSDLYSLGIILYEMLAGYPPFHSQSPLSIVMQHVHEKPPLPETRNPAIAPAVSAVILKCIAKDPEERYPTAAALVAALEQAFDLSPGVPKAGASSPSNMLTPDPTMVPTIEEGEVFAPIEPLENIPTVVLPPPVHSELVSLPPIQASVASNRHPSVALPRPGSRHRSKKRLLLLSLLLLIVVSGLLATYMLWPRSGSNVPTVIGSVKFARNVAGNGYTALKIDIPHITDAPAGDRYYAWIISQNEYIYPHWSLVVKQGAIHTATLPLTAADTTVIFGSLFLITQERADVPPAVPDTDPQARLYYAKVPAVPVSMLNIQPCPPSGPSSICT